MNATKLPRMPRPGDVLAIAIPRADVLAHARVWRDATIGVYLPLQRPGASPPIGGRHFAFQVGVAAAALRSGRWPRVGRDPFAPGADPWPAARFVEDMLSPGRYQIYHRGQLRDASRREVEGLEPAAVWLPEQVEDRIVALLHGERVPWLRAPWTVPELHVAA